jgi:hypothetical protein
LTHGALDVAQQSRLVGGHQTHRPAGCAGSSRATDTVHIVFRYVRQLVVDDLGQFLDVETTRRHFSRDERGNLAVLKITECTNPCRLTFVAVNGGSPNACGLELLRQAVSAVFGSSEHQCLMPGALTGSTRLEQVHEQMTLVLLGHLEGDLLDPLGRRIARCNLDRDRIFEHARG